MEKGKAEPTVDETCSIYVPAVEVSVLYSMFLELWMDLFLDALYRTFRNHYKIITLQQECTRASCPEMKAGE